MVSRSTRRRRTRDLDVDVVTAARQRIINAFSNGLPIFLGFSGGKDSIVVAHLIYQLAREGRIDKDLLRVQFIDEEAVYDSVITITKQWRRRFQSIGITFDWFCIEVRHFNCFNQLTQDESFICWDSTIPDRWVRPMPPFAITDHPELRRRQDTYQEFFIRRQRGGIRIAGLRNAESIQRNMNFTNDYADPSAKLFQPIYDWRDSDVWLYIKQHDLDIPEAYLNLYRIGASRREMRLSQFFSIDTAKSLVRMSEHEPDLMQRVIRREPNAYLASLYWDSELFRRSGGKAQVKAEPGEDTAPTESWEQRARELMDDPAWLDRPDARRLRGRVNTIRRQMGLFMDEQDWRDVHSLLQAGDPKSRALRALTTRIAAKKNQPGKATK